jgi:hypothetical protein
MQVERELVDDFAIVRGPYRIQVEAGERVKVLAFEVYRNGEHIADLDSRSAIALARCEKVPDDLEEWATDPEFLEALWAVLRCCPWARWHDGEIINAKLRNQLRRVQQATEELTEIVDLADAKEDEPEAWHNIEGWFFEHLDRLLLSLTAVADQMNVWVDGSYEQGDAGELTDQERTLWAALN